MQNNNTCISDMLGCTALCSAALSTLAAGVVVTLPGLFPAWATWGLTLGGGLLALFCAVSSLGLRVRWNS